MNLGRWLTFFKENAHVWAFELEMGSGYPHYFKWELKWLDNAQGWVFVYIEGKVKDKWRVWDLHYRVDHNEWCCEQRWATLQGESFQQMDLLMCIQNWGMSWCVPKDGLMCANRGRMKGPMNGCKLGFHYLEGVCPRRGRMKSLIYMFIT